MEKRMRNYRDLLGRIGTSLLILLLLFYVLMFSLEYLVAPLLYRVMYHVTADIVYYLLQTVVYMACFMLPVFFFKRISRRSTPPVRPMRVSPRMPKTLWLYIVAGVGVTQVFAVVNSMAVRWALPDPTVYYFRQPLYIYALEWFSTALAPAFCEEFLFRGMVDNQLEPYGKTSAIVISSVLFGLMHSNASQLLYATMAGLIMAYVYQVTGSIFASGAIHLFNNTLAVLDTVFLSEFHETTAYRLLFITYLVIFVAGFMAILWLIKVHKRREEEREEAVSAGFYQKEYPLAPDACLYPIKTSDRVRMLLSTPQLWVFFVCCVLYASLRFF